jgi:glutamine amidotransferase PdxT
VNLGTRSSEIPVITNKADLLTQSSLSAMDLSKQEDFSATASRLQDPQITTSLREVEVVAKYEERLNAHLNFSMLMNSFDSESTDGSP